MPLTQIILFGLDLGIFTLIWLVQFIIYPSFLRIDKDIFIYWHHSYTYRISYFVIPLMFSQIGLSFYHYIYEQSRLFLWHLIFIVLSWISTFTLSVPCHNRLALNGYKREEIIYLINTNYPRALTWSFSLIISTMKLINL